MLNDRSAAQALLGQPVDDLTVLVGGGNNRLFRVRSGAGAFVMKRYATTDDSGRHRFERETAAARFLAGTGLADRIPRLIAADRDAVAALFEWIDGEPPRHRRWGDVAQMVEFIAELRTASLLPTGQRLGEATEACLSPAELAHQIDRRRDRLATVQAEPALSTHLDRFDRSWQRLRPALVDRNDQLAVEFRTLSPSDFGLHNALRRPDGRLVFLDFEYFGWDDPVKLVADILWHPGMALQNEEAAAMHRGLTGVFARFEPGFARRLSDAMPAFGLRWCLILLNEFLPERWERRRQARAFDPTDWQEAKQRQLAKAEHLIARVEACRVEVLQ